MNLRTLSTAMLVVSSLFASEAVHAAPVAVATSVHAMFGKTKLVTFSLRNDTALPLKLKAGDSEMTIEAGKTLPLKLPAGTSITTQEATDNHPAGAVIAQVSSQLSGVTISVK